MNINYELYKIFYTVAKNENITKASVELMISQPAISKSIKNLEEQLGGELFTRTKRGVTLTEEGKEFYKYIEQAILYINNAESKFTELISLNTGKISIGSSSTLLTSHFLAPYLGKFHKLFPKIHIEVVTGEVTSLVKDLRNGLLDMLIVMLPIDEQNDLEIINCLTFEDVFIVGDDYMELHNKEVKLETLTNYPLIFPVLEFNDRKNLDKFLIDSNVQLKPAMELSSYTLIKDFTKNGFGIGFVPSIFVNEEVKDRILSIINIEPKIPHRYIAIAHLKRKDVSFSTKKLIELIIKE